MTQQLGALDLPTLWQDIKQDTSVGTANTGAVQVGSYIGPRITMSMIPSTLCSSHNKMLAFEQTRLATFDVLSIPIKIAGSLSNSPLGACPAHARGGNSVTTGGGERQASWQQVHECTFPL